MTAIASMRNLVIAQVPDANDLMIDRMLVETARDFCAYTRAWRSSIVETVTAGTLEVAVTPPTDGELVDVMKATLNEGLLLKRTREQLDEIDTRWETREGNTRFIAIGDVLNDVLVAPLSGTTYTDGLRIRAVWKPVLGAAVLNTTLVSRYSDTLIAGTLSRLFAIPSQGWTDNALASYYASVYAEGRNSAKQNATDNAMTGVVRKVRYGGI